MGEKSGKFETNAGDKSSKLLGYRSPYYRCPTPAEKKKKWAQGGRNRSKRVIDLAEYYYASRVSFKKVGGGHAVLTGGGGTLEKEREKKAEGKPENRPFCWVCVGFFDRKYPGGLGNATAPRENYRCALSGKSKTNVRRPSGTGPGKKKRKVRERKGA